nr:immunoglobulin heavy chain junction region [Mus musculus]
CARGGYGRGFDYW